MAKRDEILERLNDVHTFPGPYIFKVIGDNTPTFVSNAVQACLNILGPTRESGCVHARKLGEEARFGHHRRGG